MGSPAFELENGKALLPFEIDLPVEGLRELEAVDFGKFRTNWELSFRATGPGPKLVASFMMPTEPAPWGLTP